MNPLFKTYRFKELHAIPLLFTIGILPLLGEPLDTARMQAEREKLAEALGTEWNVSLISQNTIRIESKFHVSHYEPRYTSARDSQPYVIEVEFAPLIPYDEFKRLRNEKAKLVDSLHTQKHDLHEYGRALQSISEFRIPKYVTADCSIYIRRDRPFHTALYPFENWLKCEAAAGMLSIMWNVIYTEVY